MAGPTLTAKAWSILILLSVLWGGSFFFIEIVLTQVPPFTLVTGRLLMAGALLWLVAWAAGQVRHVDRDVWMAFAVMGLLNNGLPFCLIVWGQQTIAGGLASVLNATTPLFTLLVAHVYTHDEKLSARKLSGVIIGFGGVLAMVGATIAVGSADKAVAQVAVLMAAFSYACAGVYGRRFARASVGSLQVAAGQLSSGFILVLPLALVFEQPWLLPVPDAGVVAAWLALALLSSALAYYLYFRLLALAGATNMALVTFLIPVTAILLGAIFLQETLSARHWLGMTAIAIALCLIDGRPLAWLRGVFRVA